MTNVPCSAISLQFTMQQKGGAPFPLIGPPQMQSKNDESPSGSPLCVAGLRTSPQLLVGFGLGAGLRGVSPGTQLILSPAQPGSRSSTRHDLLPGEPNAVTSPFPRWRFCGIFFIGPRGLSVRVLPCARALATQRWRCRFPVPLSPATVFSLPQVVLSAGQRPLHQG